MVEHKSLDEVLEMKRAADAAAPNQPDAAAVQKQLQAYLDDLTPDAIAVPVTIQNFVLNESSMSMTIVSEGNQAYFKWSGPWSDGGGLQDAFSEKLVSAASDAALDEDDVF
ncbi:MAG: hypothetical protein AAGE52_17725 [Myxococcota bacterium]